MDKSKKGKPGAAPPPPPPPTGAKPSDQTGDEKGEEIPPKIKSVQPKDQVGTRKGCRRYKWEFKDSNREFWVMGHAEVKILCLVSGPGIPGRGRRQREGGAGSRGFQRGSGAGRALCGG